VIPSVLAFITGPKELFLKSKGYFETLLFIIQFMIAFLLYRRLNPEKSS